MFKYLMCFASLIVTCFQGTAIAAERFHSIEKMCVSYEMKGQLANGTTTRCHRNYAHEWFEIQKISSSFGEITHTQHQHIIAIADKLYTINLTTGTGTVSQNPLYQTLKDAIAQNGNNPEAISASLFQAMGFVPTGETRQIAGLSCSVMDSQAIGSGCFTNDLIMLEQSVFGNTQRAVDIKIGVDGGDENYTLWQKVSISQGPDLSKGLSLEELTQQARGLKKNQPNQPQGIPQFPEGAQVPEELKDLLKQLQPQ